MWGQKKARQAKASTAKSYLVNRRGDREDRRSFGPPAQFPFIDSYGKFVKIDRRVIPDRRIANIQVKEDDLSVDKRRFTRK